MTSFLPTKSGLNDKTHHHFNGKEPQVIMKNLTFEQASSLKDQGIITEEKFDEMIDNGKVEVFRFRTPSDDKPEIVKEINSQMIELVKASSSELLKANFKPSISWSKINKDEEEEY